MKKLLSIILAALMCFSLTACGEETPEEYLDTYLSEMQNLDTEQLKEIGFYDEPLLSPTKKISKKDIEDMYKKVLTGFTYNIGESKIDGNNATVEVAITNINLSTINSGFIKKLKAYILKGGYNDSEDKMEAKIAELLFAEIKDAQNSKKEKTINLTVKFIKGNDGWEIIDDNPLIDAVVGGLMTGMDRIEKDIDKLD